MAHRSTNLVLTAVLILKIVGIHLPVLGQIGEPTLAGRAKAEIAVSNRTKAKLILQEGLKSNPEDHEALLMLADMYEDEGKVPDQIQIFKTLVAYFPERELDLKSKVVLDKVFQQVSKRFRPGGEKAAWEELNLASIFRGGYVSKPVDVVTWKASWQKFCQNIVTKGNNLTASEKQAVETVGTPITLDFLYHIRAKNPAFCKSLIDYKRAEILNSDINLDSMTAQDWQFKAPTIATILLDSGELLASDSKTSSILLISQLTSKIDWNKLEECPSCAIICNPLEQARQIRLMSTQQQLEYCVNAFRSGTPNGSLADKLATALEKHLITYFPKSSMSSGLACPEMAKQLELVSGKLEELLKQNPTEIEKYIADIKSAVEQFQCSDLRERVKSFEARYRAERDVYDVLQVLPREIEVNSANISQLEGLKNKILSVQSRSPQSLFKTQLAAATGTIEQRIEQTKQYLAQQARVQEEAKKQAVREAVMSTGKSYLSNINNDAKLRSMWAGQGDPVIVSGLSDFNIATANLAPDGAGGSLIVDIEYSRDGNQYESQLNMDVKQISGAWKITGVSIGSNSESNPAAVPRSNVNSTVKPTPAAVPNIEDF